MASASLRGFLTHAKDALRAALEAKQSVTFVIGNESADLDSMSCSLLYACLRSKSPPKNAFSPLYIPITNLPATDLQLRPEYAAVLRGANIEPSHLITLDDLPPLSRIESELAPQNTAWVLVDHNALQGQLGQVYSNRVVGVIDHHVDEGTVPSNTDDEPHMIEMAGSCTSLVTNYLQAAWDALPRSSSSCYGASGQGEVGSHDVQQWEAELAQLGLASILIDTANLLDTSKTTDHDRKAVEYLEAKISLCPQWIRTFDRKALHEQVSAAKAEVGGLKLPDILRKDYKQWEQDGKKLGISSVVKAIDFLQEKANQEMSTQSCEEAFLNVLYRFAEGRALNMYALMTASTSAEGEFQRELLLCALDKDAVSAAKEFAQQASNELGLDTWHGSVPIEGGDGDGDGDGHWRRVWRQKKVQHSRKRIAPLLRNAMLQHRLATAGGED